MNETEGDVTSAFILDQAGSAVRTKRIALYKSNCYFSF
jgi:hypothetical protein